VADDEIILLEDGPANKTLRVLLREFKGTPLLDLRYWYEDKNSGEVKPTSKGISLTRNNYVGLRSVATDHHDTIMEYLRVGAASVAHRGDQNVIDERQISAQQSIGEIKSEIKPLQPSSKLFEVDYEGSVAQVSLNENHSFIENLNIKNKLTDEAIEIISTMLLSLDMSLLNYQGDELTSPQIITEQLDFDFARYTGQLSRTLE